MVESPFPPTNSTFSDLRDVTQAAVSAALLKCWGNAKMDANIPLRKHIDPADLGTALPFAFILEHRSQFPTKFRLVGNVVNQFCGMDMRGMPFLSIFDPSVRGRFFPFLDQIFTSKSSLSAVLATNKIHSNITAAVNILPLRDDFGEPTKAIGTLFPQGKGALGADKFALWPQILASPIKSGDSPRFNQSNTQRFVLEEPKSNDWVPQQERAPALTSERPYLKLVRS